MKPKRCRATAVYDAPPPPKAGSYPTVQAYLRFVRSVHVAFWRNGFYAGEVCGNGLRLCPQPPTRNDGSFSMKQPLRLLLIEDSDDDAILLLLHFRRSGWEVVHQRVDSADGVEAALDKQAWDIVISDYAMPGFNGLDALRLVQGRGLDIPFIVVSGQIGEEPAVAAMKAGPPD